MIKVGQLLERILCLIKKQKKKIKKELRINRTEETVKENDNKTSVKTKEPSSLTWKNHFALTWKKARNYASVDAAAGDVWRMNLLKGFV